MRDVLQSDELFDCKQVKNFINCTIDIFFREIKIYIQGHNFEKNIGVAQRKL